MTHILAITWTLVLGLSPLLLLAAIESIRRHNIVKIGVLKLRAMFDPTLSAILRGDSEVFYADLKAGRVNSKHLNVALNSGDEYVRWLAINMGGMELEACHYVKALKDSDVEVRKSAAKDTAMPRYLIEEAMRDAHVAVREAAASNGMSGHTAQMMAVQDPESSVKWALLRGFMARDVAVLGMMDADPFFRAALIKKPAARTAAMVLAALKDKDKMVVESAREVAKEYFPQLLKKKPAAKRKLKAKAKAKKK